MKDVKYIEIDPPTELISESARKRRFVLEPGQVFRAQDMYIELRCLDFFGGLESANRWTHRLSLRKRVEQFVMKSRLPG